METRQITTPGEIVQDQIPIDVAYSRLDMRQQIYIDFCAAGGLVMDESGRDNEGNFRPMTVTALAAKLEVHRDSLYRWQKTIPAFWAMVDMRGRILFTEKRKWLVWRGLLVKAMQGEARQAEMVLSHFSDYKPPAQKVEQEIHVKGLGDLVLAALAAKRVKEQPSATADDRALPGPSA